MTNQTHLVVCAFDGATLAEEARLVIRALDARLDAVQLGNIAVVSKGPDGQAEYWETAEVAEYRRTSTFGAVTGWLLGLVGVFVGAPFGPAQASIAGETLGTSELLDREQGFPDEELRHLAEQLQAGSSLLLTLVRPEEAPLVVAELERLGGRLIERTLHPEILKRLVPANDS